MNKSQNYNARTAAMPHQIEVINHIFKNNEVALFDEQGLGKTKIVIESLCWSMKNGDIDGVLVIAPMSLLYNWQQEVKKHSFLIPMVLKGTTREIRYKMLTGANFYIINYESVIAELDRIKRFCRSRKMAIVLDESARIKDPSTKTAQSIFALSSLSIKRIILSGTPVANKPYDLWAQFLFLDQGRMFGDDFETFKKRFDEHNDEYQNNLKDLKETLNSKIIRRTKDEVLKLPEKNFYNIYLRMSGGQARMYNTLRKELIIEITNCNEEIVLDQATNILKKLLRLTQIASNPFLIDKRYAEIPVKFTKLDELLVDLVENKNDKVLIWTSFVDNIVVLKARYKRYNPLVIYGEIPIRDRAASVEIFQNDPKYKIMILNPSAAREGITLTNANNAIYLDRTFNLVDYLQSQDRIHRISQTKDCNIYKLLIKNSIDEYIDLFVETKKDIANYLQGDNVQIKEDTIDFMANKSHLLGLLGG